jgi:UDP-N-acetylglucosamine 2-epimerase (non-hydrolysing)
VQTPIEIAVVLGTRPELIKLAPVINILAATPGCTAHVVLTNQHQELLNGLVDLFDLPDHHHLPLQNQSPNLPQLTSQLIHHLDHDLLRLKNCRAILVQGDTTTALAAALVGFYHGIPVGHVEAGLRTKDLAQPFPEEFNRQVIGKIATWHFCPTQGAAKNLLDEEIPKDRVHVVGNTVVDALNYVREKKLSPKYATTTLKSESPELFAALEKIDADQDATTALVTLHRRESQGQDQERIFATIRDFAAAHPHHHFVYPYHLNPKVKLPAFKFLSSLENVHLIPPLTYRPMVHLMSKIDFAISDSGGIQEEMPSFRKPLLIMRNCTERPEVVDAGFGLLVGHDELKLRTLMEDLVSSAKQKKFPKWFQPRGQNPFGDGLTGDRICQILLTALGLLNQKSSRRAA